MRLKLACLACQMHMAAGFHTTPSYLVGTRSETWNHSCPVHKSEAFTSCLKRPCITKCVKRFLPLKYLLSVLCRPLHSDTQRAKESQVAATLQARALIGNFEALL